MASHVPTGSSSALAVPSLVTASGLSSVPGLLVSYVPGQVHTITHQLTQATIRQGVPSPPWGPGQLGCISPSSVVLLPLFEVQLLRVLQLGTAHDDGDTDHPCLPSPHTPPHLPPPAAPRLSIGCEAHCAPHPAQQCPKTLSWKWQPLRTASPSPVSTSPHSRKEPRQSPKGLCPGNLASSQGCGSFVGFSSSSDHAGREACQYARAAAATFTKALPQQEGDISARHRLTRHNATGGRDTISDIPAALA